MKLSFKLFLLFLFIFIIKSSYSQKIIEYYEPIKNDSLRIGTDNNAFLPFIASGYTLMLPKSKEIKGVIIFLEDSGYDKKNKAAKQIYKQSSKNGFAVLSVSTEIPFDFYFSTSSTVSVHNFIHQVFKQNKLPNKNIFFLGTGLIGHRAIRYIKVMKQDNYKFQLNIKGIVICNMTMDFTRKWYQYDREIKMNRNNLWEAKFINYMLEKHLKGSPKTNPKNYKEFSAYSYFSEKNDNINFYKEYAVRAYIEPAIKYGLNNYYKTLYENNSPDMVGFLAELKLAGNKNTELIVLEPKDNPSEKKTTETTWNAINKDDLINWIIKQ